MKKSNAKDLILERGLKPKKSFGQNFMLDQHVNTVLANAVFAFGEDLHVIEIGAGTGALTRHLLLGAKKLDAIERDRDLVPILNQEFAAEIALKKMTLHEADGARFDLSSIIENNNPAVLVGNLPYHLTSSIIFLTLQHFMKLRGAVFLVQKEVADRLNAQPNSKEYGFLTVVLQLLFTIDKVSNVNRNAFWPVPKIDSAIIRLSKKVHDVPKYHEEFIAFVREIFQQRRKKLSTILRQKMSPELFNKAVIDANLRPENLTPEQFWQLFLCFKEA